MVWYSHLLKNFPQLIVIHTVKGFGTVNKAEIDVFLDLLLPLLIGSAAIFFPSKLTKALQPELVLYL